jgi:hypothetical protein
MKNVKSQFDKFRNILSPEQLGSETLEERKREQERQRVQMMLAARFYEQQQQQQQMQWQQQQGFLQQPQAQQPPFANYYLSEKDSKLLYTFSVYWFLKRIF